MLTMTRDCELFHIAARSKDQSAEGNDTQDSNPKGNGQSKSKSSRV